jgi:hypothetical protein
VAAGVAGLGLFLAVQSYRPPIVEPPPPPGPAAPPLASSPASPSAAASAPQPQTAPAPIAKPPSAAPVPPADQPAAQKREALAAAGRAAASASKPAAQPSELVVTAERRTQSLQRVPLAISPAAPAPAAPPPPPPPPPPPQLPAPPPEAIPALRPAPPASQNEAAASVSEEVVTGRARDAAAPRGGMARPAAKATPFTAMTGPAGSDPAARLRAAAAAGRTGELAKLLDQGVPVDAADGAGDTALMKSVRADRPAAAALLRRHGASLERTNQAGESARDLAADKGDPALDRAIGIAP